MFASWASGRDLYIVLISKSILSRVLNELRHTDEEQSNTERDTIHKFILQ